MALKIGQLAAQARVNVETVRYYERRGLIAEPRRTTSGYRQYSEEAVRRIRFIRRAQDLGFSLKEIAELLDLRVRSAAACGEVERRALDKIALVEEKIGHLGRIKDALERLAQACEAREPTGDCPILETLETEGDDA